ncbi:MAG TPA: putative lipid II flippase FtsW [Spirochaetia bacterium]|nr:putative lipid II flippase FtsW [Spirochaetia bacterium]
MTMHRETPDFTLFITVLALVSFGVVMVFSASMYSALTTYHDSFYFLKRQLVWVVLGLGAMIFAMNFDYRNLRRLAAPALVVGFALLLVVLVPGVGKQVYGAQRWIIVGPLVFTPSELVKLCLVIFTAFGLARRRDSLQTMRGLMPFLVLLGLACGLILLEPDLGTAVTLAGTIFIMFFAAGANLRSLGFLGMVGVAGVGAAIVAAPYRMSRFLAFLDPWKSPQGVGYHIIQSLYALGSGGLFGVGLGQSKLKFLWLPASHTDFIFAIVGEELGFLGATMLIALFGVFAWRGYKIAVTAPDPFASLLAAGLTTGIILQAVINMGVVTSSLPVTGIPLPLVSYGGTSVVFTLLGVGILLNISRFCVEK